MLTQGKPFPELIFPGNILKSGPPSDCLPLFRLFQALTWAGSRQSIIEGTRP